MSETPGARPTDGPSVEPVDDTNGPVSLSKAQPVATPAPEAVQESPQQPYDTPTGAQQYGQPPATGYQPPATDPPGQSAPVQGPGPQQYGQPEHGQASYAQEGFPTAAPGAPVPPPPSPGQQPMTGTPGYGPSQPYGQPPSPGQQPYQGQQPYGGQVPYPGHPYPPQPYVQQAPMSDSDQRLWATLTNISIPFFGFVGPLVAYLLLKDRGPFLKDSTTEALNFSITVTIAAFASGILTLAFVGYVLLPLVGVAALVFAILAAIAANKGEVYRYPLNWRLVK